jgi:hypothetical protein
MSRKASSLIEGQAAALYEKYKKEDEEDNEQYFERESLVELCSTNGLIGPEKLSEAEVNAIFEEVKSKRTGFLTFEKFQNALRKIGAHDRISQSYEELVATISCGAANDEVVCVAGESGPIGLYLATNKKFKERHATLDTSGGVPRLIITAKPGMEAKDSEIMGLPGAIIDRTPDIGSQRKKTVRQRQSNPAPSVAHVFKICQSAGNQASAKSFMLQANSHEIKMKWVSALVEVGQAVIQDSKEFELELRNPDFASCPLGSSGVGKSTFMNLLTGAMWIGINGELCGYEDAMFARSGGLESKTTADDALICVRGWCGKLPVIKVMDTPGLLDTGGSMTDSTNVRAIVEKLKEEGRMDVFILVLNATNVRFTPQEAEIIEVLDKILSSPGAGSFLRHTIIILNRADQEAYRSGSRSADLVDKIKASLHALAERKSDNDDLQALVAEHDQGMRPEYTSDELWDGLKKRTFLFPTFGMKNTHTRAAKTLKQILGVIRSFDAPFDCSGVREAQTRMANMQKMLREKEAKIADLESKMKELDKKTKALSEKEEKVNKLIEAAKKQGLDTTELEAQKVEIAAEKSEIQQQYEEYLKQAAPAKQRDAVLQAMEVAVGVVEAIPLPGITAVCAVAREVITMARAVSAVTADIVDILRLMQGVMEYMETLSAVIEDSGLDQQHRERIGSKLEGLEGLLGEVKEAIEKYRKKGFIK